MEKAETGVIWFDRYAFPSYWGFCPTEKAWKKQMKLVGCEKEPYPSFETDTTARCTEFVTFEGKHVILITLGDLNRRDPIGTVAIIAHELEHVWQMMKKHMGEDKPGDEVEAYVKQAMLLEFLLAYEKERVKLFKKIK